MELRDYFLTGSFKSRDKMTDLQYKAQTLKKVSRETSSTDEKERTTTALDIIVAMTPYLTSAEMLPLWNMLGTGTDRQTLPRERQWYGLFRAIGSRDAALMLDGARGLLAGNYSRTQAESKYLLATGMVGALAQGKRDESARLWANYSAAVFGSNAPDLHFRLLAAESLPR
jgi:hypothetical protein